MPLGERAVVGRSTMPLDLVGDQAFELEPEHDRPRVRIRTYQRRLAGIVKRVEVVGRVARRVDVNLLEPTRPADRRIVTGIRHCVLARRSAIAVSVRAGYSGTPIRRPTSR